VPISSAGVAPDLVARSTTAPLAESLERVLGLLRRVLPIGDLSLTAASALLRLEQGGPRRLTELAGLEGVTQPAMTQLVSRLERGGLAVRGADPQDGRVVLIEITPAGREAMRQRRTDRAQRLTDLLAHLTEAERDAIAAALPAIERLTQPETGQP
jgi:DNA-binding MarR family transcriptional regulator